MTRPLVLVPARHGAAGRVSRQPVSFVVQPSIDALRHAGAQVWVLPPDELDDTEARSILGRVDGLCLQGGADLGDDPLQDRSELALTRAAIELARPVLALCRGAELLNVACGGTLCTLDGSSVDHSPHDAPGRIGALHDVAVQPGTLLDAVLGVATATVSSVHHQAIDRVADDLVVSAVAADGVVEAVERSDGWVLGVQWHPEDTAATDPLQQRLFERFVAECRRPN